MAARANLLCSPSADVRLERARAWLEPQSRAGTLWIVASSAESARALVRSVLKPGQAVFAWRTTTLARAAYELAAREMAARELIPVGPLALEAVCHRVVHDHDVQGALGPYAEVASRPGLPRALARTFDELRMASASVPPHDDLATLSDLQRSTIAEARQHGLADRAELFRAATVAARAAPIACPLLLIDLAVSSPAEAELVAALADGATDVMATIVHGDVQTRRYLTNCLGGEPEAADAPADSPLAAAQTRLFDEDGDDGSAESPTDDSVVVMSAPGEDRECVEIARRLMREAEQGVPFDRMAVLLHAPSAYRAHLEEALRRAAIPAHFSQGTVRPDASGRALLSLLACAAEDLSARRFAEYLSLGEVPDADVHGRPPVAPPSCERYAPSEDELVPGVVIRAAESEAEDPEHAPDEAREPEETPVVAGSLRAPRRWERLLVDAAVIGGLDRWERRLEGLSRELELLADGIDDPDDPTAQRLARNRRDLHMLREYALPILRDLAALPTSGTWEQWLDALGALATRTLRSPQRVLSVLSELRPMGPMGPIRLADVRLALEGRLSELTVRPTGRRQGRVLVAPIDAARGLSFDVVFLPGLAERVFPRKVVEDPILLDELREQIMPELATSPDRVSKERLALHIALGAARRRIVLSYPRLDTGQSRPRVPSFYGLEVLRAAEGRLPGFDELSRRAELAGGARIGWPAPKDRTEAIDEAEFDLSSLERLARLPGADAVGEARYLLGANPHLSRALYARARRALSRWVNADGLVAPSSAAMEALARHRLSERAYSPTALQTYAACPYRFLLYAIHRLSPREAPESVHELPAAERGSLMHEVLFRLFTELRDDGRLPITPTGLAGARDRAGDILDEVAARYRDELAPAIERVWTDGIESVRADLRELLQRASVDDHWQPARFELSFGLGHRSEQDEQSVEAAVSLEAGIRLRGSIDLVEKSRDGHLRASDYKTGKVRADAGSIIGGGETLQPVLYALALESLFPDATVDSGRLYYCTSRGEFAEVVTPLDDRARRSADAVATTIDDALASGFLPAAPRRGQGREPGACRYCDYRVVCGPDEERRTERKPRGELEPLTRLRALP